MESPKPPLDRYICDVCKAYWDYEDKKVDYSLNTQGVTSVDWVVSAKTLPHPLSTQGELTPAPKFTQALESIGWIKAILVSEGPDGWKLEQIKHELERCK